MNADTIEKLVDGTFADPDGDGSTLFDVHVKSVVIEKSLEGREGELVRDLGIPGPFAVVSDANTYAVLGRRVERALQGLGKVDPVHLDEAPHADMATAMSLAGAVEGAGSLIAVGAGTVNDLCKYVSARLGKPMATFGTAPSMNGYSSVNAAITEHGHKKSLPAVCPLGIFFDLEVLSRAPVRMIRSGFGDSVCRATAQVDWLLSHLLLGGAYRSAPFEFLVEDETALFSEPEALMSGDLEAMARLARLLVLSGMGMTVSGGSYPASQGEHLISHYIEMRHPVDWDPAFHGEQIAVTTCVMARLQRHLMAQPSPRFQPSAVTRDEVVSHFGENVGDACWMELEKKLVTPDLADDLNQKLERDWDGIRNQLAMHAIDPDTLVTILNKVGAPVDCSSIGLEEPFFRDAVLHAREIRNRFTFLDFAAETGNLHPASLV